MNKPHPLRIIELPNCGEWGVFFSLFLLLFFPIPLRSQNKPKSYSKDSISFDTITVKKGTWFNYKGKTFKIKKDTVFIVGSKEKTEDEMKNVERSNTFYDSVYKKLSRRKFSQVLYELAFRQPKTLPLPGNSDKVKSDIPFAKYKGKIIRFIRIKTLDPFGTSIIDTLAEARTSVGKALNAAHAKTHPWVIRKNLFIKEGQKVDPFLLADNEQNLRGMSFINNVRTCITPTSNPVDSLASDSVDITIITTDVWSIGFDIVTADIRNVTSRLYDGNFLGLADRVELGMSIKTRRQPFFLLNDALYSYNNIAGTFLNTQVNYSLDDIGNQNIGISFNRNFYSINTKWAFGAGYTYYRLMEEQQTSLDENESPQEFNYFNDKSLWGGRAFRISNSSIPMRFVITESYYQRAFSYRPAVTIDSNKAFYNTTRFLTGFAFSANSYYLSDYIFQFGKTENIPYGEAFKLTMGPEINDFYTRFYGCIDLSAGDFISGFGYLSGRGVLGGYLNQQFFEDGVLKLSMKYLSPLYMTPNKKFKFRGYLFSDYRFGFNFRQNNLDYTDINHDLLINNVNYDTVFWGRQSISTTLAMIMYTPFYFYGFKFAFILQGKGGFLAASGESLFHQPFSAGVGLGIMIRNDNLIFHPITISFFYYPSVPHGVPGWQLGFGQEAGFRIPNYNITMPQTETLQN